MKIESTEFTDSDLASFGAELVEHERLVLAGRIERAASRLRELGVEVHEQGGPGREGWSAIEVLAHVAVLSKFYGWLAYQVGSGRVSEVDLLAHVSQRDVAGAQLASMPAAELVSMAVADLQRSAEYLRTAPAAALTRRAELGSGLSMSTMEVLLLPLVNHVEIHLDQLHQALEPRS